MSNNKDFVGNLANELAKKGSTMNQRQVSSALNASGRKTTYGTDYQGGRGTNKLVSTSCDYFDNNCNPVLVLWNGIRLIHQGDGM